MRAIVLVKQVPDVRIGNVGMHPDGTIDRSSAPAIINPADLHAIEAALAIAEETIALSMGPPRAESTLRQAISMGVDRGVLLSDRLFAGSDTWATANALAAAVRYLGGADIILSGLSAIDGETGHVGPQVAQRLEMAHVTGCEEISVGEGRLTVRRVVEGGYEIVSLPIPAMVTVSETGFLPRYPTLPGRRAAARAEIVVLGTADLGLDDTSVGLGASPTKVARMELVPLPKTQCRLVDTHFGYDDLVADLVARDVFEDLEEPPEPGDDVVMGEPRQVGDATDVWVVCETRDGALARVSAELISKAADLAPLINSGVAAVIMGSDTGAAAAEAAEFGADVVLRAEDERLDRYTGIPETKVLSAAIRYRHPEVVLFGATTTGRSLAPRVAAAVDTGIAADCTDLYIADWDRRDHTFSNVMHQVRPAMAGGVLATCLCPEARPQMATVRPGVFSVRRSPRPLRIETLEVDLQPHDLEVRVLERALQPADVSLADAEVIVAGGAGCDAANWHLIEGLAAGIGGKVAASRAAVEAGLAPRSLQVGQTGSTVRPKLYIACGISGALQHVVGMRGAATVVAVNRDPEAAIFRFSHYGVIGDVTEVLPLLTAAFAEAGVTP